MTQAPPYPAAAAPGAGSAPTLMMTGAPSPTMIGAGGPSRSGDAAPTPTAPAADEKLVAAKVAGAEAIEPVGAEAVESEVIKPLGGEAIEAEAVKTETRVEPARRKARRMAHAEGWPGKMRPDRPAAHPGERRREAEGGDERRRGADARRPCRKGNTHGSVSWEVSPAPQRQFYQHGEAIVDGSFGGDRRRGCHLTTVSRRAALVRPV